MCGIAGIINAGLDRDDLDLRLRQFERDLRHRGPDDSGRFISKDGVAGLISTRLAIQDLSPATISKSFVESWRRKARHSSPARTPK